MYFLMPIEQGLDVKFTGGIHRGCLRVQAAKNGSVNSITDLRGKRIGVPGMGTPPFIFANRVLGAHGIDASKEITWRVFPAGELGLALDKGEVDAVADSEDRKSTRLNSSHVEISYAVFCLKKKTSYATIQLICKALVRLWPPP